MNANDERYNIIISVIWGFGLASIFRKVCKGRKCIVYKHKNKKINLLGQTNNKRVPPIYKLKDKCYKYEKKTENCN